MNDADSSIYPFPNSCCRIRGNMRRSGPWQQTHHYVSCSQSLLDLLRSLWLSTFTALEYSRYTHKLYSSYPDYQFRLCEMSSGNIVTYYDLLRLWDSWRWCYWSSFTYSYLCRLDLQAPNRLAYHWLFGRDYLELLWDIWINETVGGRSREPKREA